MITLASNPSQLLSISVKVWFFVVVIGQMIFSVYIMGLYGVSGIAGDFERWNTAAPHGYVSHDLWGNVLFGVHVALAAIITIAGPLQLVEDIRLQFPRFHRYSGRLYICCAFLISTAGFYLTWVRGNVGGLTGNIFISINGILIFLCAYYTVREARNRHFVLHRRWAIRLFLAMSGVWFFRVSLMLWLTIHQAPVGFDPKTFQGPTLNGLYVLCYIFPIAFVELYFRAKEYSKESFRSLVAALVLLFTLGIAVGTISATLGMWLPRL